MPAYKRILLKLSGEALMGDDAYGINRATIVRMVREVQEETGLDATVLHLYPVCGRGVGGGDRDPLALEGGRCRLRAVLGR